MVDTAPLAVRIEADGRRPSIILSGKANRANVSHVVAVLEQVADHDSKCVSLDMQDLESLETSALQDFAKGLGAFKDRNCRLHLSRTSNAVRDVLDRHHLWDMFCLCQDCSHDCSPEMCGEVSSWDLDVFTMSAIVDNIRQARLRTGRMAREAGFTEEAVNDILVAVGEAITNAVKYGSKELENPAFTVSCLATSERFCVSVSDSGPGFCVNDVPCFEDALFLEHGRGIYCMKALMDEVTFHFGLGTTVRMVKQKS